MADSKAAGLKQREIQNWYVQELHEKQPFESIAEMAQEMKRVKAIIQVPNLTLVFKNCFCMAPHFVNFEFLPTFTYLMKAVISGGPFRIIN
jgi:hypothetical protein